MTPQNKEQELRVLFNQWLDGRCDEQAINRLSGLADDQEMTGAWHSLLESIPADSFADLNSGQHVHELEEIYQRIVASQPGLSQRTALRRLAPRMKYAAAAIIIILAGGLGYFLITNHHHTTKDNITAVYNIVPANTRKAILTLGNGTDILLDQSGKDLLAQQGGNTAVLRPDSGYITYAQQSLNTAEQPEQNTVRTPNGGEYKIVLPDGTLVWLNAASSLTFPTAFTGAAREVSVTGEAYFEVTQKPTMPFRVKINNNATVEVLGTHFNISAYQEDPEVKTTLLEGAVRIVKGKENRLLKPGQQARFTVNGGPISVAAADVTEAIAWKNGAFDFRGQDITTVMNQIGRWYNVEIVYEGTRPPGTIFGMISKSTDLLTVLKSLELTSGIHFETAPATAGGQTGKIIVRQ